MECWLAPTNCDTSARFKPASFARAASSFTSTGYRFPLEERFPPATGAAASFFFLFQNRILSLLSPDYAGCCGRNVST
jgi:hypothetical protein